MKMSLDRLPNQEFRKDMNFHTMWHLTLRPSSDERTDKRLSKVICWNSNFIHCVVYVPRICPLCQLAMSPTNVVTLAEKIKKVWVLPWGGGFQTSPVEERPCLFDWGSLGMPTNLKSHLMNSMAHCTQQPNDVEALLGDERLPTMSLLILCPGVRLN